MEPTPIVEGYLEQADRISVTGWARNLICPETPVQLLVMVDGVQVGTLVANMYRSDLMAAGKADGFCAFHWYFPYLLDDSKSHEIRVQFKDNTLDVPGSPAVVHGSCDTFGENIVQLGLLFCRTLESAANDDDTHKLGRDIVTFREQLDPLLDKLEASAGSTDIVFLDGVIPYPDSNAGSTALISHMKSFVRLGFDVIFILIIFDDNPIPAFPRISGIRFKAVLIGDLGSFFRRQAPFLKAIYVHRMSTMLRAAAILRRSADKIPVIYSVADLQFLRVEREFCVTGTRRDGGGLRSAEIQALKSASAIITHSIFESTVIKELISSHNVFVIPWETLVREQTVNFDDRSGIAFLGHYNHPPNLDAAQWLVNEIMPIVWKSSPDIECLLVGQGLPEFFPAALGDKVKRLGYVSDLGAIWGRARLTVASLRFGAGIKGKIVDSYGSGLPCITTSVGAEGLGWPSELDSCVVDTAEEFAAAIVWLHMNKRENERLVRVGTDWVSRRWSVESVDSQIASLIDFLEIKKNCDDAAVSEEARVGGVQEAEIGTPFKTQASAALPRNGSDKPMGRVAIANRFEISGFVGCSTNPDSGIEIELIVWSRGTVLLKKAQSVGGLFAGDDRGVTTCFKFDLKSMNVPKDPLMIDVKFVESSSSLDGCPIVLVPDSGPE